MENTLFENVEQDAEESNEIRREYREIREQMNGKSGLDTRTNYSESLNITFS